MSDQLHSRRERPPCRAEIGSPGNGWRECGRPSVIRSTRQIGNAVYDLEFCERHKDRASRVNSRVVRILKTEAI